MLLAYEGATEYDEAAVRRYQDERWGRTAVLELSAIAAKSISHAEDMRLMHLEDRIASFRRRLAEHAPEFVVFYGLGTDPVHGVQYLQYWSAIAQHDLIVDEPVRVHKIIFVARQHPVAFGTTNASWMDLGRRLRATRDAAETP